MKRGTFHGRVILADRSFCSRFFGQLFFFGALLGNRVAGMEEVYRSAELQEFLSSFLMLVRSGQLEPASFGAALFSYFKYPILVFGLSFFDDRYLSHTDRYFYQGFMFSFAVSAFYILQGSMAWYWHCCCLAFGVLWCCRVIFWLASSGMALAVGPGSGSKARPVDERAGSDAVWRFIFAV